MSFAYEVLLSELTADELALASSLGRLSTDEQFRTFRAVFLPKLGLEASDPRLVPVAADLDEWRTYVNTPGGKYTPMPTQAELDAQAEALKQSKIHQLSQVLENARYRVGRKAPFQTLAYQLKEEAAQSWDGTGEAPEPVQAYANRYGITTVEACDEILSLGIQYRQALVFTENQWDYGITAIEAGDDAALQSVTDALNAIGT